MTPRPRPSEPLSVERGAAPILDDDRGDAPPANPGAALPGAVSRVVAAASSRLARFMPGGNGSDRYGRTPATADPGFEEALRDAFRTASPLKPARPAPRPASEGESTHGDPAVAVNTSSPATLGGPGAVVARELGADVLDGAEATRSVDATAGLNVSEAVTRPAAVSEPAAGAPPADDLARPIEHEAGPAAPAALLEVPESVAATADDFFGGLIRRVERRP